MCNQKDKERDVEVVVQRSSTQRVTIEKQEDNIQLNKEWRKSTNDDWAVAKGISIPKEDIPDLVGALQKTI